MTSRFDGLASSCDHSSIFSLTYLRVTEEYRRTIEGPFFDDTPFVNYEDTLFAHYYFAAYDSWAEGRIEQVPPAWRVAFDGEVACGLSGRATSCSGSTRVGATSARALPVGLLAPTGAAARPTTTGVDIILNRVADDITAEIARRFDPTVDDSNLPTSFDDAAVFQSLAAWRRRRGAAPSCSQRRRRRSARARRRGNRTGRGHGGAGDRGGDALSAAHRRRRCARRLLRRHHDDA